MKTLKQFSIFVAVMAIVFASCNQSDVLTDDYNVQVRSMVAPEDQGERLELAPEMFDAIGLAHNDALDYVFYNVLLPARHMQQYFTFEMVEVALFDFFEFDILKTMQASGCLPAISLYEEKWFADVFLSDGLVSEMLWNNDEILVLAPYFTALESILFNEDVLEDKLSQISDLNNEISSNLDLNNNQLALLYMTTSVASHSLLYWHVEGGVKWASLFGVLTDYEVEMLGPDAMTMTWQEATEALGIAGSQSRWNLNRIVSYDVAGLVAGIINFGVKAAGVAVLSAATYAAYNFAWSPPKAGVAALGGAAKATIAIGGRGAAAMSVGGAIVEGGGGGISTPITSDIEDRLFANCAVFVIDGGRIGCGW